MMRSRKSRAAAAAAEAVAKVVAIELVVAEVHAGAEEALGARPHCQGAVEDNDPRPAATGPATELV